MLPHARRAGKRDHPRVAAQCLSFDQRTAPFVNDLLQGFGAESWKPVLTALLLPPVPWLVLVLIGARLIPWQRFVGWLLVIVSVAGIWLGACAGVGEWMARSLMAAPPPLSADRVAALKRAAATGKPGVVVLMLGGGREAVAPEYGVASLVPLSLERLRYGVWLSRETGAPMMFSGGLGHAAEPGTAEAEVAADIAQREFLRPIRWVESKSRDTRENAQYSIGLLRELEVSQVVLVTHGWHMPRALRAFREGAAREKLAWEIVPAPMGLAPRVERAVLRWIPSSEGSQLVRAVLRERLGWYLGA
jgi:uncharacterized SAM-binding protein YcdF (DUF218 family)